MISSPLAVYVLWHPKSDEAECLSRAVYRWFHSPSDDLLRSGMGLPVYFRSQPASEETELPPPINLDAAKINVVVVLADASMVSMSEWSTWLSELANRKDVLMVPVALHKSAYRLPEALRRLNYLQVDSPDDPTEDNESRIVHRAPRLLRQLTEVVGRELLSRVRITSDQIEDLRSPPPLTVFLSHAKRDGVMIAEALRSVIQENNRMRAFFDSTDLPVGHAFALELDYAAGTNSAAMIAIVTDDYAARPWCRREVDLARKPRREPDTRNCWANRPLLVIDQLTESPTRNIPEFGNATVVRWRSNHALSMVDLLMLEVTLGSFHRLRARLVPHKPNRHVISWTPDATSLLALLRLAEEPVKELVYPGNALPESERRALANLFPDMTLTTFEDAMSACPSPRTATGRVVGLSIGFNSDLASLGLGKEHLEEITLRIARCVVEAGGRIAFGGMMASSGLTETLLTLVRTLSTDDDSEVSSEPIAQILSYQRWPALPSPEQVASDVGIAEYVLIENPLLSNEQISNDLRISSPERARQVAYALSAMRCAMSTGGKWTSAGRLAPPLDACIVVGGRTSHFNGFLPGILEETLYAIERRQAVYILGGFGGAGKVLGEAILGGSTPQELRISYHSNQSAQFRRLQRGLELCGETSHIEDLFTRVGRIISVLQNDPVSGLNNGLDISENRQLSKTDDVAEIVELLNLGISRIWSSSV